MYNQPIQNQPIEPEVKSLSTIHYPLSTAFTLIELLVVMTIMVMLVAVSVPMLKPMFESQKTKNAAQTVAAALQRVRFKAMEEQKSYGIEFVPFETSNNVALKMRLVKQANHFVNSEDYRVQIYQGQIVFYQFNPSTGKWTFMSGGATPPEWSSIPPKVDSGYEIQFDRQGRWYKLASPTTLASSYSGLTLPEDAIDPSTTPPWTVHNAMEYKVRQPPRAALTPPVVLPRGTVVDLAFSNGYEGTNPMPLVDISTSPYSPISIMFTPNGDIDYDNNYTKLYGGLIYFCIGEWDRQITDLPLASIPLAPSPTPPHYNTLAEDGKSNIETMTNFWVTLHPRTGAVRITEMAPFNGTTVESTRKFAAEHFGISE